jgi:hypothetical protein
MLFKIKKLVEIMNPLSGPVFVFWNEQHAVLQVLNACR